MIKIFVKFTPMKAKVLILLILPLNIFSQELDSAHVSKVVRLIQDYKICKEINDTLENRIDIYEKKVTADSVTINRADSVIVVQDTIITDLSNENYKLTEKNDRLKKRRKFWFIGGLATGLSAFFLLLL